MILLGKNETKLTCFNFVVGKGLTLVTLVWLEEPWKLRWNGCRVAKKRTKNEYFVNQTKDRSNKNRTKNDYFVNQTKDRMASTNT